MENLQSGQVLRIPYFSLWLVCTPATVLPHAVHLSPHSRSPYVEALSEYGKTQKARYSESKHRISLPLSRLFVTCMSILKFTGQSLNVKMCKTMRFCQTSGVITSTYELRPTKHVILKKIIRKHEKIIYPKPKKENEKVASSLYSQLIACAVPLPLCEPTIVTTSVMVQI